MRILLTNSFLASRTGSEMALRDYALAYKKRGHAVTVFANVLSHAWQLEFASQDIEAVERIDALNVQPDIVHGQHTLAILPCIKRFPDTPIVQWLHDRSDPVDIPLRHPSIAHYIAIDESRAARARDAGADAALISVIPNAVDLERFTFSESKASGQRALCIVKRRGLEQTIDAVDRAARSAGWSVDFAGAGVGKEIPEMQRVLLHYAVAITSGRCALEAIATGLAVIVCDYNRIFGLATPESWQALRHDNLGLNAMSGEVSEERIAAALSVVDVTAARAFALSVRSEIDLAAAVQNIETLYRSLMRAHAPLVARGTRALWAQDLEQLAGATGAAHLAHWRKIAGQSDAEFQSSAG